MISVYYWNHLLELCCPFRFIWGVAVFLNWNCSRVLTLVHYQDLFLKVIFYPSNNLSKWIYALIFFTLSCEANGIIKWIKYKILFFVTSRSIVFDLTKKKTKHHNCFWPVLSVVCELSISGYFLCLFCEAQVLAKSRIAKNFLFLLLPSPLTSLRFFLLKQD